jgi:hypothetical protein
MLQPTNRTGVVNKVDPYPQILGGFADGQPRPSVSARRLFRRCAHVSYIDRAAHYTAIRVSLREPSDQCFKCLACRSHRGDSPGHG